MRRHRQSAPPPESSSSSEDEDAFSAFSSKKVKRKQKKNTASNKTSNSKSKNSNLISGTGSNSSISNNSSSVKRHHGASFARQAKMDALLLELENEKKNVSAAANNSIKAGHYGPGNVGSSSSSRPPPDKRGSFVEEGEEHLTTNIFVGNLAPSVTEEALTDLFRQFGDLYSVKIMWPRTAEERARNRNTGFVCFMTRDDAQEAMDAYNEEEVFGRRMVLRWGKNVKKTVKRGTGGVPIPPIRKKSVRKTDVLDHGEAAIYEEMSSSKDIKGNNHDSSFSQTAIAPDRGSSKDRKKKSSNSMFNPRIPPYPIFDPLKDRANAVRVKLPNNPFRLQFITTVASFVAKDGSLLEKKIIERESLNPLFSFLDSNSTNFTKTTGSWENLNEAEKETIHERVFYRWRVFSFSQGDGLNSWRTEPFLMFDNGRWWIPPSLNHEAAQLEEELAKRKEDDIIRKMDERRRISNKKDFMTGRQLEHAKFGNVPGTSNDAGGLKLNDWEKEKLNILLKKKLCASRNSICEAMSFFFDKSGAAVEIAGLLKDSLLEDGPEISVDTRIARLYLMSDVLFNSQQPGVRNAFRYRDAIEAMAPEVFLSMGKHGNGQAGRMTMNKLRQAINGVLNAWTNWSVYNSIFIDELQMKFEGKEIIPKAKAKAERKAKTKAEAEAKAEAKPEQNDEVIRNEKTSTPSSSQKVAGEKTLMERECTLPKKRQRVDWKLVEDDPSLSDVDGEKLKDCEIDALSRDQKLTDSTNIDSDEFDDREIDGESFADDEEFDREPFASGEFDNQVFQAFHEKVTTIMQN